MKETENGWITKLISKWDVDNRLQSNRISPLDSSAKRMNQSGQRWTIEGAQKHAEPESNQKKFIWAKIIELTKS